jgi:hypothetical protein
MTLWTQHSYSRRRPWQLPDFIGGEPALTELATRLFSTGGMGQVSWIARCGLGRVQLGCLDVSGLDSAGRVEPRITLREGEAELPAAAYAVFHEQPVTSEVTWPGARLEVASRYVDEVLPLAVELLRACARREPLVFPRAPSRTDAMRFCLALAAAQAVGGGPQRVIMAAEHAARPLLALLGGEGCCVVAGVEASVGWGAGPAVEPAHEPLAAQLRRILHRGAA